MWAMNTKRQLEYPPYPLLQRLHVHEGTGDCRPFIRPSTPLPYTHVVHCMFALFVARIDIILLIKQAKRRKWLTGFHLFSCNAGCSEMKSHVIIYIYYTEILVRFFLRLFTTFIICIQIIYIYILSNTLLFYHFFHETF